MLNSNECKRNSLSFSKMIILVIIFSLLMSSFTISTSEAADKDENSYKITSITGIAYIKFGGGSIKTLAYEGMTLNLGDSIITDDYSYVELLSSEGDLLTIYANSILTITELTEDELHLTSWVGSSYMEATSRKDTDKTLLLNTPSSQFIIRGTHFITNVHPITGDSQINLFSGMVQSNTIKKNVHEETNNNQDSNFYEIFPTQFINVISGQQFTITFDPNSFIQEVDPDVLLKLLLNKESIDTENEELNSEFIEQLIQLGILSGAEERSLMEEAIQNYINIIIQNALEQNLINAEELPEELLNTIQLGSNIEGSFRTDILNRQQGQLDLLRQQQEARERQLEEQNRRQEELQRRNQELLEQLQKQREEQEKQNREAQEEQRRQAEERLKERLSEQERERFEQAQKQREEERKRMEDQQLQKQQSEEKRKQQQEQANREKLEQQKQVEQSKQDEQQKNDNQEQEKKENQNQNPIHVTPSPPKEEPKKDDTKEEEKKEEPKPKPPAVKIDHIDDLFREVQLGGSFSLPSTVLASMSDGTNKQLPIKWVSNHIDTSRPGAYQLTGTVAGYSKLVRLHYYVQAGNEAFLLLPKTSQRDGNTWIISSAREKIDFYLPEAFTNYAGIQVHFLYDPNITVKQVTNPYSESWITAWQEHRGVSSAGEEKVELVYSILFDKNKNLPSVQFLEEHLFTLEVEGISQDLSSGTMELKKVSGYYANGEVKEIKIKKPDTWHKKDYRVE